MSCSGGHQLVDLNKPFIFRVHQRLSKQNEEAYEPQMLSIGPYHRGKENLRKMEMYKHKYLQGILERRGENADRYNAALKKDENKARACYSECISLSSDDFVEMMLLDGCFIIEFLRKHKSPDEQNLNDIIFSMEWYRSILYRDLLLFENQLPFFVLKLLFDMTEIENHPDDQLISLSISCLSHYCLPGEASNDINPTPNHDFHLLSLMHESWCSSFIKASDTEVEGGHQNIDNLSYIRMPSKREQVDHLTRMEFIKSARELKEHGIKFKKANQNRSWLDIKFENGIMQIPMLMVEDNTESLFRNLIAYEQYTFGSRKVVTDYTTFIDRLINSSEDVQMLCHKKIITNWLGSDEQLSDMFNKIGINVFLSPEQFTYRKLFLDVNEHCRRPQHRWIADLKIKYFHNPWSIISFLAAILLLLLTLAQTILTSIQVLKDTKDKVGYNW